MPSESEKTPPAAVQQSDKNESAERQSPQAEAPKEAKVADNSKQAPDSNDKPDYGYDLYPERQGGKYKPSFWEHVFLHEGENLSDQITCEKNVYNCFKKSHGVRLMLAALKASGCPVDMSRNVSCETCEHIVTGGYDPSTNQVPAVYL